MTRFLMTLLAVILGPITVTAVADEKPEAPRTKIVLIGHKLDHPFGSHMYLHECRLLAMCLKQTPGVEAVVSDRWPNDPQVMQGVNAIVFYSSPAANLLLTGPHEKQAEKLLADGVGYTAVHWGTGARGEELGERYLRVLGGWFDRSFGGLAVVKTPLIPLDTQHPICRGWKQYELRDEIYLNTRLMPESKPILKVKVKGEDQIVGWVYNRPNSKAGRSFGITLGHFHDNFAIPEFRRAIVNGILWTAHREVPRQGAPVTVSSDDLDLGPDPRKK